MKTVKWAIGHNILIKNTKKRGEISVPDNATREEIQDKIWEDIRTTVDWCYLPIEKGGESGGN